MNTDVAWEVRKLIKTVEEVSNRLQELTEEEPADVRDDIEDVVMILHDALWELDRMTT